MIVQTGISQKSAEKVIALRKIILILQTFNCANSWRTLEHRIFKTNKINTSINLIKFRCEKKRKETKIIY